MAKKWPGKYKKKNSCRKLSVRSQRLRRARERKEKERLEKRDLETRGNDNVTFPGMFNSHSLRAVLQRTGKLTVARIVKKPSSNTTIGKELTICNISTNSSITVPLRRIGRRTIARISNKLPANALLGTDTAMCRISNIPSLSVPPGRSRIRTVGRVLKKPFVNPLSGKLIAKNSHRKVFHNPLRCEVISRKGETIVYDRSATVMLSKNLTVPKVSDYTSLGALLCRSMTVACVISKPSSASLETTLNAHENSSSARSEDVTDSLVVNGPPTIASFENVTAFNACSKPYLSLPLLKRENVTDEDDSNKLSVSASLKRCENVTDASVIIKHSSNVTADTCKKEPSIISENVTLPGCSSPALPLDESDNVTVDGVPSSELPSSEKDLPQDPKHGAQDSSRPKEKNEGPFEPPKITSDKKFNKELAAKHKTPESIDLNLISVPKTTICTDATNTAEEWLAIEQYHVVSENKFPGGRFICDLRSVIRQAREIEAHTATCHFGGKLTYYRTTREGLVHTFHYSCSSPKCGESAKLVTDAGDGHSLNRLAVLGAVSNGSGFAQEENKFKVMNVKYMNRNKFAEYESQSPAGKLPKCTNKATMTEDAVTADGQMPVLLQPKIEMDFCVDENWLG